MIENVVDIRMFIFKIFRSFMFRNPSAGELEGLVSRYAVDGCLDGIVFDLVQHSEHCAIQKNTAYPPGHFYSALVDINDGRKHLSRIKNYSNESAFHAINVSVDDMDRTWNTLSAYFPLAPWGEEIKVGLRYYYNNKSYPFTDALVWFSLLNYLKPSRVIEIGSGFSSAVMLDTVDLFFDNDPDITFIQPFPHTIHKILYDSDWKRFTLLENLVQDVPLSLFDKLESGDVLFIDSTHVVKTGSDVVFEIIEILPRLKPGVFVHFHDIFYPFEYPQSWIVDSSRSWNEIYALRAYLLNNLHYKIVLFNNYQTRMRLSDSEYKADRFKRNPGGGLWLQRTYL